MTGPAGARLTIDLDALAQNHAVLKAEVDGAEVGPVLKSDGYGLGAGPVARRLWTEGARSFFVARLAEGEDLRAALGPDRPAKIYVLDGFPVGAGPRLMQADLIPCLSSLAQIDAAASFAAITGRRLAAALHVDTGMNRQGLDVSELQEIVRTRDRLHAIEVGLIMSHLGSAADPESPRNLQQLSAFLSARALFPGVPASLSASAGIFLGPEYRFDMVRPGISLFGGGPRETPDSRLSAVATLTAPIVDIRRIEAGQLIGYGEAVRVGRPTRLAIVGAGYSDGIIRASRAGGYAWCAGARRPLLVVNMDVLAIEIGDADVRLGEPVELLGPHALLDDLASAADTVAHEVLVRLSRRAERILVGAAGGV